jgi:DNA-binding response OmpR family regulator
MSDAEIEAVTVLLVDDEEDDRALVREALRSSGYTVLEANSFRTCVAVFERSLFERSLFERSLSERKQGTIQLLIADVSLEDGNGCDLALALWKRKPDLRVLFVSGHVGAEVCRFYGLAVTDLHFLRKPFAARDLLARVQQVLSADEGFPRLCEVEKPRTSSMGGTE